LACDDQERLGALQQQVVSDETVWVERSRFVKAFGWTDDYFGSHLAISGGTVLIGLESEGEWQGAGFVFVRSGATWEEQASLVAPGVSIGAYCGVGLAISGDTAVLGCQGDTSRQAYSGSAHVFVRSGSTWSHQQKINGLISDIYFGLRVALDGDTLLAYGYADGPGVAVYVRSGSTWTRQQKLAPPSLPAGDYYATSFSVEGDTALVGDCSTTGKGSAYVFTRTAGVWTEQQRLIPSGVTDADATGCNVALDGDTALVAAARRDDARGGVSVFTRSNGTWTEQQTLTASDGVAKDQFGSALALEGDTALIGSRDDEGTRGSAFVFTRNGATWSEQQKLSADDGAAEDHFGGTVALEDDTWLVSAPNDNNGRGTVYVFESGLPLGATCTTDGECVDRLCRDGVCCDQDCTGTCRSCRSLETGLDAGKCGDVLPDRDPDADCAAEAATTCGTTGACDGQGQCELQAATTVCGVGSCISATRHVFADACDGSGSCLPGAERDCATGYLCVAGACKVDCDSDEHCDEESGYVCSNGACKRTQGNPCASAGDCASTNCVDGFCCDQACADGCLGCAAALTGSKDGECAPIPADQDPKAACAPGLGYPASCGADGSCDGAGSCRALAKPGIACGASATTCSAGQVSGLLCDGAGTCRELTTDCGAYACAGDVCATQCSSDNQCDASDAYCLLGGSCAPKQTNGRPCVSSTACESGFCSAAVCCETECHDNDFSCREPGREGTCVNIGGAGAGAGGNDGNEVLPAAASAEDDGGCGCRTASTSQRWPLHGLTYVGLALVLARRRRRRQVLALFDPASL
jgi:MYXO-CTERM domain-containing protein